MTPRRLYTTPWLSYSGPTLLGTLWGRPFRYNLPDWALRPIFRTEPMVPGETSAEEVVEQLHDLALQIEEGRFAEHPDPAHMRSPSWLAIVGNRWPGSSAHNVVDRPPTFGVQSPSAARAMPAKRAACTRAKRRRNTTTGY